MKLPFCGAYRNFARIDYYLGLAKDYFDYRNRHFGHEMVNLGKNGHFEHKIQPKMVIFDVTQPFRIYK